MTKSFIVLVALILVWGISVGGAFVGGSAFEKSRNTSPGETPSQRGSGGSSVEASRQPGGPQAQPSAPRSGRADPSSQDGGPALAQRQPATGDQQSPEGESSSLSPSGRSGRGLAGTIESIEGDTVTLDTARGPIQVTVDEDTIVSKVSEAVPGDLTQGAPVAVLGRSGEDGKVAASAILVSPEGIQGFLGSSRGSGPPRNRPSQ